ncbi:protein mono-ADP-ribosyltransferase PARP9 [Centroberyx affinis]|uniref:protein mono-ADP-ribosyltransferase PARP9 n=1 Tax=Centroberyx affinis TaxID=166261 RepID=UPI003A5BFBF9
MASKLDVPLQGPSFNIVRQCGPALKDVLQSKFGCSVEIHDVDFDRDPSSGQWSRPTVVPKMRYSAQLQNGVKVSVWKADLTNFTVDAVVNAANDQLEHYGGLAQALSDAGGPEIQRESKQYIKKHGALKTGEAAVTNAGKLPCKKIIHAVGPRVPTLPTAAIVAQAEPRLTEAVWNILALVEKHNLQSVAIPALSSGLFNFPLPRCADIIVTTLKKYYDQKKSGRLPSEIFLVNHDDPSVSEMERACRRILANTHMSYSQAAGSQGKGAAKTPETVVQIGKVSLTLAKGRIEEQQTDVIVNTTSQDFKLSGGEISSALLKKAGYKMQSEMDQHNKYHLTGQAHIIPSKPYDLKCKQVYHTVCPQVGDKEAQKILSTIIYNCLTMAATAHHRSIAFPAIGTGNLKFNKSVAAQIMTRAAADFAQKASDKMDIHFVIYPPDNVTFKAFEDQMRFLQGFEQNDEFRGSRTPSPQISLSSPSEEMIREAERWLTALLNSSSGIVTVRNNFIQYFGEQEFQQLSRQTKRGVVIEEFFQKGCAGIIVKGESVVDVAVVGVRVEAILCNVQKEFVREEEKTMTMSARSVSYERKPVDYSSSEFSDKDHIFKSHKLQVIRVDKVENRTLKEVFELKRKQLGSSVPSQKMYQRIPAQFCDMVSHVGFQREYAPPDDPKYGEGIYFTDSVTKAMEVWKDLAEEEYLYFVEAEVLTGKFVPGQPDLIVPPAVGDDPVDLYDSVRGGTDISVIFSGYQALPKYTIICKKPSYHWGATTSTRAPIK